MSLAAATMGTERTSSSGTRKRPTVARVTRVRRMVLDTLSALEELESRRSTTIGVPLIRAEVALGRWIEDLQDEATS